MINSTPGDTVQGIAARDISPLAFCSSFCVNKEYFVERTLSTKESALGEFFLKNLTAAIEALGVKKKVFAENSGISQGYLSDILKGRTTPSDRVIKNICSGNSLNESWLKTGTGEMLATATTGQEQKKSPYPEGGAEANLISVVAEGLPSYNGSEISDEELHFLRLYRCLTQEQRNSLILIASGFALNMQKRGDKP